MYHNSLNHEGETLRQYQQKAMTQDEKVLDYFTNAPFGAYFTPSKVHHCLLTSSPLTSVRRSMNTLTKQGKLIKTDEQRMGPYGRPETVWRLAGPVQGELL